MNRYELLERLGDGSFGEVIRARSLRTNEIVAIKKIKAVFPTWEECLQLRELRALRALRHDNIVQLKEVVRDREELYFVFEYMHSSLHKVLREHQAHAQPQAQAQAAVAAVAAGGDGDAIPTATDASPGPIHGSGLSEAQIKSIMYQLFAGLAHMHKHGFFHRDIKPENLLCHDETLKLADLGQAREIRSRPPFTDYVATRWYRSPELLLRAPAYNSPIDLWACGCILAELYLGAPLFPGASEADQLARIARVLGTPTKDAWPDGITLASLRQFRFPKAPPVPWHHVLPPTASRAAAQLLGELLQYDPGRRLTAAQALQHRFFDQQPVPRPSLTPHGRLAIGERPSKAPTTTTTTTTTGREQQRKPAGGDELELWPTTALGDLAGGGALTSRWRKDPSAPAVPVGPGTASSSRRVFDWDSKPVQVAPLPQERRGWRPEESRAEPKSLPTDAPPPRILRPSGIPTLRFGPTESSTGRAPDTLPMPTMTTTSWLSARKWSSPEADDDDEDHGSGGGGWDAKHRSEDKNDSDDSDGNDDDDGGDDGGGNGTGDWDPAEDKHHHHHLSRSRSGRRARHHHHQQQQRHHHHPGQRQSQEHLLQDLLDEFLV